MHHTPRRGDSSKDTEMGTLLRRICLATLVLACALPALSRADGGSARLEQVRGSVLVARGSSMASADEGALLEPGERVLTTDDAVVVVVFEGGCRVKVGPNERFLVERPQSCREATHLADQRASR
jgi:hypothetical protein